MVCRGRSCTANPSRRPGRLPCTYWQCIFPVESWRHITCRVPVNGSCVSACLARSWRNYKVSTLRCNQMVVSVCLWSCHNMGRCRSRRKTARFVSPSLRQLLWRLKVGSINACNLTQRAPDGWDSARFWSWF